MSYRAFKRLLGETSLERKTRWLLGAGVLILMAASFYVYAHLTENLAYEQLETTGRALLSPIVAKLHVRGEQLQALEDFQKLTESHWPASLKDYNFRLLKMNSNSPEYQPGPEDTSAMQKLVNNPGLNEQTRQNPKERSFYYYGAIRAGQSCIECHSNPAKVGPAKAIPDLQEGQLMAVVRIRLSTETIEEGFHRNRAYLISFAIGTSLLIITGSYLIIRYVIVKPVKHLKAVSEAIAAGRLDICCNIQTGDEFEDLSHTVNRMLRNLAAMQERNRALIADLDRKVDELARVNMALYESNRLKSDFLATMSHELRTPLNSIIGFSEVLLGAENLTDKQHRYAGNIMTAGRHLLTLINDILELAKLEAGKMRLHVETVDLARLCEAAAAQVRPLADKKNIDVKVIVDAPITARQDAGKLNQILANLLSNAVKFTPDGGRVILRAALEKNPKSQQEELVLTVQDTGVGIAPEEQELVFEKFRQAANPLTREQGGTGLGLSIVREMAKLLGGDVSLQSELGRGSIFTVRVAARLPEDVMLLTDLSPSRENELQTNSPREAAQPEVSPS